MAHFEELPGSGPGIARIFAAFWIRRAFRLLPSALLTIVLTFIFVALFAPTTAGGLSLHLEAALAAALQVFNIWGWRQHAGGGELTLFGAYWSLSLEEQFYLVFPFVMFACGAPRRLGSVALAIVAGLFFIPKSLPDDAMWWFRIDGLFWGVAIASFRPRLSWLAELSSGGKAALAAIMLAVCGLGLTETIIRLYDWRSANAIMLLFAAALVLAASQNARLFDIGYIGRLFIWLGERSYLIYLVHILVFAMARVLGDALHASGAAPEWTLAAQAFLTLASLVPIEVLHTRFEVRFRELGGRLSAGLLTPFAAAQAEELVQPEPAELSPFELSGRITLPDGG